MKAKINAVCLRKNRGRSQFSRGILFSVLCGLGFGAAPGTSFGAIVFEDVNPDQSNNYQNEPTGRASAGGLMASPVYPEITRSFMQRPNGAVFIRRPMPVEGGSGSMIISPPPPGM